jgi:DNA-directed RNA polymerase subunit M/transcription elongation factor TFIIS
MTYGVAIALSGVLSDLQIPAKTADVLEWIRKKYKNSNIQFQGKLQDPSTETRWLSIFASTSDDDENTHMLPAPFDEETYTSVIVVLSTESDNQDEYDRPISEYKDIRSDDYETLYQEWTFAVDEDEEDAEAVEDEEVADAIEEDVVSECEEEAVPVVRNSKPAAIVKSKDVFVNCSIREKVISNFTELLGSQEKATEFEGYMLKNLVERALKDAIEVDWANRSFWNMYRSRAVTLYENMKGTDSYVQNNQQLIQKLNSGELSLQSIAEMTSMDLCPSRWKEMIEKLIEKKKKLYSTEQNASIFMWCSSCKKKTKCDYYQLQTRSADEPMTTFVTCLECDKRWKF